MAQARIYGLLIIWVRNPKHSGTQGEPTGVKHSLNKLQILINKGVVDGNDNTVAGSMIFRHLKNAQRASSLPMLNQEEINLPLVTRTLVKLCIRCYSRRRGSKKLTAAFT